MNIDSNSRTNLLVRKIEVEGLFNRYSYVVDLDNAPRTMPISVLYGGNGRGKTTILNLLFHLLAPGQSEGHRTWLGRVPVKSFFVTLADGVRVGFFRDDRIAKKNPHYRYTLSFYRPTLSRALAWHINERDLAGSSSGVDDFCEHLCSIQTGVYVLTDTRELLGSSRTETGMQSRLKADINHLLPLAEHRKLDIAAVRRLLEGRVVGSNADLERDSGVVARAISRFHQWALQEARMSSNRGELNSYSIYSKIVEHIKDSPAEAPRTDIIDRLNALSGHLTKYEEFGIIPELDVATMIGTLSELSQAKKTMVGQVLNPYVESMERRIEAFKRLKDIIETFVQILNDFYSHKSIGYNLQTGLTVRLDKERGPIDPLYLSSGERQLLVLFSNVISLRSSPSILLIDEPELSLNPTWQRKLFPALSKFVEAAPVHIICATHSMEILSQNYGAVHELKNPSKNRPVLDSDSSNI